MKIFKRKFLIKLVLTMLLVWTILLVKMAIDTSVPNLHEPIEMLIFGGKQKLLRRNVGYYIGEDRVKKWGFKHMPNFTLMAEKFDLKTVGEMGEPIILGPRNLTRVEAKKMDHGFAQHAINEYVGNLVSVRRKIPDARTPECKRVKYPEDLPRTSIIMCFYNEAWTNLLRSVHSIIDRTPDRLLEEIILVDDNSTLDYLHDPLEEYMSQFPKVKLVRTGKRQGLIRARLFGFNHTSPRTSIVTFLDSHIECFEGWLEPMLLPIVEDSRAVTMPCINAIDDMTFRVDTGQPYQVGMFVLPSLRFAWMTIPEHEQRRRRSTADPIRSPAMAGGLY
ncbi:polypeptide N-acetylgalactosaminyltransferase 5 [Patella vulgata]|uniref:polypeptide N-acetylgalactosaminyltransferase 5 n=1 Tax=Patella vulgata TaxID=6465 RepID=UPI0024A9F5AF|nr:polypeptide N-acetylgalactosaminyltransferase 5 [Patella vulgata]